MGFSEGDKQCAEVYLNLLRFCSLSPGRILENIRIDHSKISQRPLYFILSLAIIDLQTIVSFEHKELSFTQAS